jgi:hypothetical protein
MPRRPRALHLIPALYAAIATLDVDLNRAGLPPGGTFGLKSSADGASRISSMVTIRLAPGILRNGGLHAPSDRPQGCLEQYDSQFRCVQK